MTTTTVAVTGMTCGHCIDAVTRELTQLDGVQDIAVELVPGAASHITVTSTGPLDADAVKAAIDEAGYDIAD